MPIITVSTQSGSYGPEIAQKLADRLDYPIYDRKTILNRFFKSNVSSHVFHLLEESPRQYLEIFQNNISYKEVTKQAFQQLIQETPDAIFMGFGARHFLADEPQNHFLHLRITAHEDIRVQRIQQRYGIDEAGARSYVNHWDKKFHRFVSMVFNQDSNRADLYDCVLHTDVLSPDACIDAICAMVKDIQTRTQLQQTKTADTFIMDDFPELKNESEIRFAKLLDRYQIDWRYEPKSFPVEWDDQGKVITAFRPDFYLPKFNLYLELTTMDQKYVAKKNRKARLAQKQYGIHVKIVYRRDYHSVFAHHDLSAIEAIHKVQHPSDQTIENHDFVVHFDTDIPKPSQIQLEETKDAKNRSMGQ